MRCNCENGACERLGDHRAGSCKRSCGSHKAAYVGCLCDVCASRMPKKYLDAAMRRFTVIRVNRDPSDTHAGESFEQAMRLANPDRGNYIEVYNVLATDGGAARLMQPGGRVRSWYFRGGR